MMYGPEKSDSVVVAGKPTNKAERFAAELAEPRTGTKGNADQLSTCWTQSQARVSQALERIRQAVAVTHPRWEMLWGRRRGCGTFGAFTQPRGAPCRSQMTPTNPLFLLSKTAQ